MKTSWFAPGWVPVCINFNTFFQHLLSTPIQHLFAQLNYGWYSCFRAFRNTNWFYDSIGGAGSDHRDDRELDPLAEFVPPPSFYDAQPITAARDEYEEYLRISAQPCDKPLEWRKAHESQFPILSRMALDLFSISLMSAEYERVFSAAKLLISDKRNRMKDDIIEVCTVLRHWLKELGKIWDLSAL